jgi:hypothetical protein
MIEAQSLGNAILKKQEAASVTGVNTTGSINATPSEESTLYTYIPDITNDTGKNEGSDSNLKKSPFDISKRVEVSALAEIFLGMFVIVCIASSLNE